MGDTLIYSNEERPCFQETEKKKKNKCTDCSAEYDGRGAHINTATVLSLNTTMVSVIINIPLLSLASQQR